MTAQENGSFVGSKIPSSVYASLQKAVQSGNYLNVSDFIRDAVKEKLQHEGFLESTSPIAEKGA